MLTPLPTPETSPQQPLPEPGPRPKPPRPPPTPPPTFAPIPRATPGPFDGPASADNGSPICCVLGNAKSGGAITVAAAASRGRETSCITIGGVSCSRAAGGATPALARILSAAPPLPPPRLGCDPIGTG